MKKLAFIGAAMLAGLLAGGNANAALIECVDAAGNTGSGGGNASSSIDGSVSVNNQCLQTGNDEGNVSGLYGITDWTVDGKTDGALGSITAFTGAGTTSGTFSWSGVADTLYMVVLKFDGVFSAFRVDDGVISGTNWGWNTDSDGDTKFAVSHISLYRSGDSVTVPEPGTLTLLGVGLALLGLGGARRRKPSA